MNRSTLLRRVGQPVAVLYPVLAAAAVCVAARAESATWRGAFAEAAGALLLHALLFAPLYFAPLVLQRGSAARAGTAGLLLPAIAMVGFYVVVGALGLRLNDGIGAWTLYLAAWVCLIVLGGAVAVLLAPGRPLGRAAAAV